MRCVFCILVEKNHLGNTYHTEDFTLTRSLILVKPFFIVAVEKMTIIIQLKKIALIRVCQVNYYDKKLCVS